VFVGTPILIALNMTFNTVDVNIRYSWERRMSMRTAMLILRAICHPDGGTRQYIRCKRDHSVIHNGMICDVAFRDNNFDHMLLLLLSLEASENSHKTDLCSNTSNNNNNNIACISYISIACIPV